MDPCATFYKEYQTCMVQFFVARNILCYNEEFELNACREKFKSKKVHELPVNPFSKPLPENTPSRPEQTFH